MDEINSNLSNKALEDLKLVKEALSGNQQAYTKLMKRYKDTIYYMLLRMVHNKTDAEDLTIEAFGKAFKNLEQYTPNYAFSTWLFKIANNNCIDFIRKQRMKTYSIDQPITDDEGGDMNITLKSKALDPEEHIIKEQKKEIVREVVSQLKPRYRILVELRFFKEYSYEEISKELDLPLGTVKAQLYRARNLLEQILGNRKERF